MDGIVSLSSHLYHNKVLLSLKLADSTFEKEEETLNITGATKFALALVGLHELDIRESYQDFELELKPGYRPTSIRPRRLSFGGNNAMRKHLKKQTVLDRFCRYIVLK